MDELLKRKKNRLSNYNYSDNGTYFITICTEDKKCLLSTIVGCGVLDAPKIKLSTYGKIVNNQIIIMNQLYDNIFAEKYVIMPNHLHLIIRINNNGGASRTPLPTNSILSSYVGSLKRFVNKQIGKSIWQSSFYDHIIRDEDDYLIKCQYVENNPAKWLEDKYYKK